ncbi:MAG: glycosyltransferase, partial [Bacteriovoracaceae bacterium]|nr:glycosyltransferase [Bacteriovoracaceae bacterium]
MGTVSVILPTYNEAANIGVLIDSILSLELDSLCEIIVVDD